MLQLCKIGGADRWVTTLHGFMIYLENPRGFTDSV